MGTQVIWRAFGPVMTLWVVVLAMLGIPHIVHNPQILFAVSPTYALTFVLEHPLIALVSMGGVVLAITGAEALYADMGHFGARAIRQSWYWVVFPALTINYFGQGALILDDPSSVANPFFKLAPSWATVPWSFSPPWRRSSPLRRSSLGPTRGPAKPCASASSRACWSSTPPGRRASLLGDARDGRFASRSLVRARREQGHCGRLTPADWETGWSGGT